MLRSAAEMIGYRILATDGGIGDLKDIYFDDKFWTIRYLVIDTGKWLPGKHVLISPLAAREPGLGEQALPVSLTREQVKSAPPADSEKPVSRQYEASLRQYYGWPFYWVTPPPGQMPAGAPIGGIPPVEAPDKRSVEPEGDPHLRSVREVVGYQIAAADGDAGHVEDFIADTKTWTIRYLVVDTRNWLPGRKVLVALPWVDAVKWTDRSVQVGLTKEQIKESPECDPGQPVSRDYEQRLYDYYGRAAYWR